MKVYAISVYKVPPTPSSTVLATTNDLSEFKFFERGAVGEFMAFTSKTLVERTEPGQRQSVALQGKYMAHVYNKDELAAVVITDEEYPSMPAFSLLNKLIDESSKALSTSPPSPLPDLAAYLKSYQNPAQQDTILRVQQELDETKIILHKTIESVLQRGENLDTLVDKSTQLSYTSKSFYKTAKKQNSCCIVM